MFSCSKVMLHYNALTYVDTYYALIYYALQGRQDVAAHRVGPYEIT